MSQDLGRFEKIFDSCLEAMLSGRESLDSALAKNPQLAVELKPRLEAAFALASNKQLFDPAPDFIQRSRRSLVSRAQREPQLNTTGIVVWLAGLWKFLQGVRMSPQLTAAAIAVAAIMIFIIGGSTTALLAEGSIPGDTLYPVKNAIEDARIGLASDPADQAGLHLEIARRRAAEIEILSQEGRWEPVQAVVADYEWHLNEAVREIKLILPQQAGRARELAETLEQMMVSHQVLLATAVQEMPELARQVVEHALSMNEEHLVFAEEVIVQTDAGILQGTPTPTPTATSSSVPTLIPSQTLTVPVKTATGTPGTLAPGLLTPTPTGATASATPTGATASPTPLGTQPPTSTVTPTPPSAESLEPTPTRKPTKTPKPRPNPTRRPPRPTPDD